jgi:hypothetical protein
MIDFSDKKMISQKIEKCCFPFKHVLQEQGDRIGRFFYFMCAAFWKLGTEVAQTFKQFPQ